MDTAFLLRAMLTLAALLLLVMYNAFRKRDTDEPFSFVSYAGNLAKSLLFCQVIALVLTLIMGGERETLLIASLYCNGMGLFGYTAIYLARWITTREDASFYVAEGAEFVATLIGACSGAALASVVLHLSIGEDYLWDLSDPFSFINLMVIGGIVMAGLLVASSRMFYHFKLFSEQQLLDQQAFEMLRLKEQATTAQLAAIQARVNPHFLYNALNSIATLVHEAPDRAEQMTLALSRLFRASLGATDTPCSTVAREVALVKTYLEIEETRFGDRLTTSVSVDDAALGEQMPRFLLQPLVENAVKHGAARIEGAGFVSLSIRKHAGALEIDVKDNGPDFPDQMMGGFGWKSVSESLELLYPGRYEVHLVNGADKHVHLTLRSHI